MPTPSSIGARPSILLAALGACALVLAAVFFAYAVHAQGQEVTPTRDADVKRQLGRIWRHIATSDTVMADASVHIRELRDRQERLDDAAEDARAVLAQRLKVLDDVNTIAAYAKEMRDFLDESEPTERRAFIQSLVKEIVVTPGDDLLCYTIPTSDDSRIPGKNAEDMALTARCYLPSTSG